MVGENLIEILLVEDNPNDAEMAIRALKKHNLANSLEHVSDGEEALEFISAKGKYKNRKNIRYPKVILLDLKLPKISGLELLKKLKGSKKTKHIPVVVLTSSREERDIVESYALGVNSYIVKPVDFDKFVKAVGDLGLYWLLLNQAPED